MTAKMMKVIPCISFESCVGVFGVDDYSAYPMSFGNYFGISGAGYCVNMWSENLREWVRRNDAKYVDVTIVDNFCIITDNRIPKEWLNKNLCFTGSGGAAKVNVYKAVSEITGLSISEFVCGCEADSDVPVLRSKYRETKRWMCCHNCKREWPI